MLILLVPFPTLQFDLFDEWCFTLGLTFAVDRALNDW